jgi:hypothetical protein
MLYDTFESGHEIYADRFKRETEHGKTVQHFRLQEIALRWTKLEIQQSLTVMDAIPERRIEHASSLCKYLYEYIYLVA